MYELRAEIANECRRRADERNEPWATIIRDCDELAASACSGHSDAQRRLRSAIAGHALATQQTARAIELTQDVAHDFQGLVRRAGIIPETCSRPIKICWTTSRRSASQTWLLLQLNCSSCLVITRPLSLRFKVKRAQRPSRDVSKPPRDISNVGMGSAYNGASRRLDLVPHKVSPYVIVPWKVGTSTHFHFVGRGS